MKIFGFSQASTPQQTVTINEDALRMYPKIHNAVKRVMPRLEASPRNMSYYITLSSKMDDNGIPRYTRGIKIIGKKAPQRSKGETLKLLWRKNNGNLFETINDVLKVKAPQQSSTFDITEDGIITTKKRVGKKVLHSQKQTPIGHLKTSARTATRYVSH